MFSCVGDGAAATRPRFEAKLSNGERIEGAQLTEWHTPTSDPKLDGKPLFDPAKPLAWLRDRERGPRGAPDTFVEMHTGDIFPGEVLSYADDDLSGYPVVGERFLVRPKFETRPQSEPLSPHIEILSRYVRRIVWNSTRPRTYQPNTIFLRDGRTVTFRALRFDRQSARIRTRDGARSIAFSEMNEIHLQTVDSWDAHLNEVAILAPRGETRLLHIETTDGLRVTSSRAFFQAYRRGAPVEFDKWVHGFQPAWCRQMLWIPATNIWLRMSYAPHETPLSRLTPHAAISRSALNGSPHPWNRDRNRDGGLLQSGQRDFGWGLGVHAFFAGQFPLHPLVRSFHTEVGIDRISANGGCAKAWLSRGPLHNTTDGEFEGQPGSIVGQTGHMVGSIRSPDKLSVNLAAVKAGEALTLGVDPVSKGFPAQADPLDIRDATDWLDPVFHLDPAATRLELLRRAFQSHPAWNGWIVSTESPKLEGSPPQPDHCWRNYWDASVPIPGRYNHGVVAHKRPFRISRVVRRKPNSDYWVMLTTFRPLNEGEAPNIEVRLDGIRVGFAQIPLRDGGRRDYQPLLFALPANRTDQDVESIVDVIQHPSVKPIAAVWAGAAILSQLPNLDEIVSDNNADGKREDGQRPLANADAQFGERSFELAPGETYRFDLGKPITINDSVEFGGRRYMSFVYRKKEGGRISVTLHHANEGEQPAVYHFGPKPDVAEKPVLVQSGELPDRWLSAQRDILSDFGRLQIHGVSISAPDGGAVLIDQLAIGQNPIAIQRLAYARRNATDHAARWKAFQEGNQTPHVNASIVVIQWPDKTESAGVLTPSNRILAPAHVAARFPGQNANVTLHDERKGTAKILGAAAEFNAAVLQLTVEGAAPNVAIANHHVYERYEPMVRVNMQSLKERRFTMDRLLHQTDHHLWTQPDEDTGAAKIGPSLLFDLNAAFIGFINDPEAAPASNSFTVRCRELAPRLAAMLKGESSGRRSLAQHPLHGAAFRLADGGLQTIAVKPDSLAAKSGLQVGDLVVRFADQTVLSISDLMDSAGDRKAGDRVALRVRRQEAFQELAVTLP